MQKINVQGEHISTLFGDRFKNKTAFKKAGGIISAPQTLFQYDWSMLKQQRCPICCNRLKYMKSRQMYLCRGAKHPKKSFVIHRKKLESL